jgi:hypothetical protein
MSQPHQDRGRMIKNLRFVGWLLPLGLFLFVAWYVIAANYNYAAVSGMYVYRSDKETSTLILRSDQSFEQELVHDGKTQNAHGTWRRIGEGGVVFSKNFLKLSGQEVRTDGQADGQVRKRFGLLLSLALNPDPNGPVFYKKIFR